jgi:hypothetical protein
MVTSLATTAPTQHFMGKLDNFEPAISDALAPGREIILFDNAGVGRSQLHRRSA